MRVRAENNEAYFIGYSASRIFVCNWNEIFVAELSRDDKPKSCMSEFEEWSSEVINAIQEEKDTTIKLNKLEYLAESGKIELEIKKV